MRVFVIQPNLFAKSEVWLHRMNQMLENYICGLAAFIHKGEKKHYNYSVINLNGRPLNFMERQLIRFKLKKVNLNKLLHDELLRSIKISEANILIVHYATTAHYLWSILTELDLPIYIYVHGYDIIWDHKNDKGELLHSKDYSVDIYKISQKSNISFIVSSECSFNQLVNIGISVIKIKRKTFGVNIPSINRSYDKEELQILFLGRFVDFKGPDIVLEAFIKACDLGFQGNLVMAGEGPLRIMCEIIARRSQYKTRISFKGAVTKEEAEKLFISSDLYTMHNSRGIITNGYDTFGVTLIEAMSYGLPVITAPVGGPSEIIINNVDGILVPENDVNEHCNAFMRLYDDKLLRKKLGETARLKVETNFSAKREKEELFSILGISE
jgi:colanic acid/amylovoran biosynthesis glycosyltransferase